MLPLRVVARLDVKGQNVVKGVHLEGLRIVGQPAAMAREYYTAGADEILFMDVVASLYGRNNLLDVVRAAASETFVPLTVGGGIRNVDDAVALLRSGADKVAVNTAATQRPEFISDLARALGSQCVTLSVEAKRRDWGWEALTDNGREKTNMDALDWIASAETLGAGEILLTSVDREGTRKGLDTELLSAARQRTKLPLIAAGGAWAPEKLASDLSATSVDALAVASTLHYRNSSISDLKSAFSEKGLAIRA